MTWKEMKDFCNGLTEEQLEKKVIVWREEESIAAFEPIPLEEDHYAEEDLSDNLCFTETEMHNMIEDNPEDFPNGIEHFKKVYDKGHPILMEEF